MTSLSKKVSTSPAACVLSVSGKVLGRRGKGKTGTEPVSYTRGRKHKKRMGDA